jgi:hypothetical protein
MLKRDNNCTFTYLFRKPTDYSPESIIDIKTDRKSGLTDEHYILCRTCKTPVTAAEYTIAVNGMHKYLFTNPAVIKYLVGCFSSAEGCLVYGEPTLEHTWFDGFSWKFSLCSKCHVHLGWHYQKEVNSFFALILDRLEDVTLTH